MAKFVPQFKHIPNMVSDKIEELLYEREHSGVITTPDETANLIEVICKYVARLWICEVLHLGVVQPSLFEKTAKGDRPFSRASEMPQSRQRCFPDSSSGWVQGCGQ